MARRKINPLGIVILAATGLGTIALLSPRANGEPPGPGPGPCQNFVDPNNGPTGTTFRARVCVPSEYIGKQATFQLFRESSGYRLNNSGPYTIMGEDYMQYGLQIPYGSIYEDGVYMVGMVVWREYPVKLDKILYIAEFTITS